MECRRRFGGRLSIVPNGGAMYFPYSIFGRAAKAVPASAAAVLLSAALTVSPARADVPDALTPAADRAGI
ncbi:hypothetical protein, partial [Actinoplanes philippinensis]|uniref:hypothetical protein n=1 Tax=Actinoplanes philippinensis TaxID=35752 RepID=UPI003400ECC7